MYNLSETIAFFFFFLVLTNPQDRVQLKNIFEKNLERKNVFKKNIQF